ncbi:MAG: nitrogen fixation protein NifX [Sulfurospirillaceae bacterium]|jgi:nitrogen fixation protein NifX|nr:nitrogen fixation protein NifX [Sulfurospirillaceae bacterium]MDD2826135.1 nitrogen fixation protein NifX [Sulfurospirillaceae bacterium]
MIKVAFFTNDLKNINAHFGSADQFAVYDVEAKNYSLSKVVSTEGERTDGRIELLSGVDIVYCTEIGPAAAARVVNNRIFPIKYKDIVSIEDELVKLSQMLSTNPPPFLKKILEARG